MRIQKVERDCEHGRALRLCAMSEDGEAKKEEFWDLQLLSGFR